MLSLLLSASLAQAGTVPDGIQAAFYPSGLNFTEDQVRGLEFPIRKDEISAEVGCYDAIGLRNIRMDVPIDDISLVLEANSLAVVVELGIVRGEDMEIFGEDSDTWDACPSFSTTVDYIELRGAELELEVRPRIYQGRLILDVVDTPYLSGDLDSDVGWFPDDAVLEYFEDALMEKLAVVAADAVIAELEGMVDGPLYGDQWGDFAMDIALDSLDLGPQRLRMDSETAVRWEGQAGCAGDPRSVPVNTGRSPQMEFGAADGSDFAVGVTEAMVNEIFQTGWQDGWFCFDADEVDGLVDGLRGSFDNSVADLQGWSSLATPPVVTLDPSGIGLAVEGLAFEITGDVGDGRTTLLAVEGDVRGQLDVDVDPVRTAMTLSVRALEVDIHRFEADHLLKNEAEAEKHMRRFIETWAAGWVASQAQDVVLYDSLFRAFGTVIRLDRLTPTEGGLMAHVRLFDADDPEVDTEAPDTDIELVEIDGMRATLLLLGSDDREGELLYRFQVDGTGWSDWNTGPTLVLKGLRPGTYELEVAARDSWLNVDPTPVRAWLEIDGETEKTGCGGCAGAPTPATAVLGLAGLLALGWRRREQAKTPSPLYTGPGVG